MVNKKTKIIATVGPACNTKEKLWELVQAGANIFRLNFSHGTHDVHQGVINAIRELRKEHNVNIAILQDLQGPKIRTDEVENNGVELVAGAQIVITKEKMLGTKDKISTSYKMLTSDVKKGDAILIDDGNIELKVLETGNGEVTCVVIYGGILKSRKGINLPNTIVSEPSLTDKDKEDLLFGLKNEVDWIALSFVRSAVDLNELKAIIAEHGKSCKVIAKVEKPEAVKDIDAIIEASDAIMVARGDLGVELQMEDVPMIQKMIIKKCNQLAKPVIVATQMMESMITNARPTRAEASDVANAIIDGTDTIMLSAETASGNYPVITVKAMTRICQAVEKEADIYNKSTLDDITNTSDSVIASACELADKVNAKAIIGLSQSGYSAFRIASHRPKASIYIATHDEQLMNQMNLVWGVQAFRFEKFTTTDESIEAVKKSLVEKGLLKKGDIYVTTASMPMADIQLANSLKLGIVE
ncbi:pyruvate kinase [Cytophaga hutchinsonii]|jgi:pyruvate kinase|uniref:Pyruvate kinase n=1 Tax=Cytophaga hutchinsonii (strain ATCC 33406 / DSM 1761 / CIP 103989 / NBRC 15051 / NCIMB 9469 / D465) TaxID=269798 RepID=A0A6N4SQW6_CYTH3|nr:pyruvate kinase [Cytophaga hutchinsonii]ABG58671.1 pyruvate kinase [Cytophaga hutchinsonii ATCC 33406]SFX59304.1 pyruvate kinase [Cytophaga hutchinsonii ATCC 33406]